MSHTAQSISPLTLYVFSPDSCRSDERAGSIELLRRAHRILKSRSAESRDVGYAAAVLQAILHRVDSPRPGTMQATVSGHDMWPEASAAPESVYQTHLDFDALPQLDLSYTTHQALDWVSRLFLQCRYWRLMVRRAS